MKTGEIYFYSRHGIDGVIRINKMNKESMQAEYEGVYAEGKPDTGYFSIISHFANSLVKLNSSLMKDLVRDWIKWQT